MRTRFGYAKNRDVDGRASRRLLGSQSDALLTTRVYKVRFVVKLVRRTKLARADPVDRRPQKRGCRVHVDTLYMYDIHTNVVQCENR